MPILVKTMDPLRIKDNSKIEKKDFYKIKNLEAKILNKTLKNLEKKEYFYFLRQSLNLKMWKAVKPFFEWKMASIKLAILWGFLVVDLND